MKEIYDDVTELVAKKTKYLFVTYNDGRSSDPKNMIDDNFIHISRGKYRFVFYNGQDKGRFTEKDVKRFSIMVDKILEPIIKKSLRRVK